MHPSMHPKLLFGNPKDLDHSDQVLNIHPLLTDWTIEILLLLGQLPTPWLLEWCCRIASADIGLISHKFQGL
jgi:hypothetical protein